MNPPMSSTLVPEEEWFLYLFGRNQTLSSAFARIDDRAYHLVYYVSHVLHGVEVQEVRKVFLGYRYHNTEVNVLSIN